MKQHFHRLRLHAAEEKLGAFAMKFFQRDLECVQSGSINCRHGTHSKNHNPRHTQERTRAFSATPKKNGPSIRNTSTPSGTFFSRMESPPSPSSLSGVTSLIWVI